jgi:DNA-binding XRE family transcriptional regulator
MVRDVTDIIKALPASRRHKIDKRAATLITEKMTLQELRRARKMTQMNMAKALGIAQKQISDVEKRTNMQISTLRRSIEAMGGKLSLIAEFPDRGSVILTGIASSASRKPRKPSRNVPKK